MAVNSIKADADPTPEFDARCINLVNRWRAGDIPFKEVVNGLNILSQEAVDSNHLANRGRVEHLHGYIQHYRGNLNTSIMHYERARSLFETVGNRRRVATMDLNQGENYRYKGEFMRARRLYHLAYVAADELDDIPLKSMAAANEGLVLISLSDYQAARSALQNAYQLTHLWTERLDDLPAIRCEIHHGLAQIYLQAGNAGDAWKEAHLALENANQTQRPLQVGFAYRALGQALTALPACPDPDLPSEPDYYFKAAREAFEEIHAEGELARTMFAQARSLADRGKGRSAARILQQVMIIFTRLGMTYDAARAAEAQLAII